MASTSGVKAGRAWVSVEAVDKTATVMKRVGAKMQAFAQRMGNLGRKMISTGLVAGAPLALSVKIFANFDDAMKKVEARSSGTAQEMKAVRDEAQRLGRQTSFTATQVAELQAKLAQKNFGRGEIKGMTKDVLNLARAAGEGGEEDTVIAADLISGTIRAFKMEAEDAGRIADVFTATVNGSNFSLQGLMDGMAKAGPLASSYGLSIEETAATLASMTNLNISAAEAGTAFTSFLARMSKEEFTGSFNKGLEELTGQTVKFRDADGNLRKPLELLHAVGEATKDLGTAERGDLLSKLFGVRQFGKATGGAEGAVDAFKLLDKLQKDSTGTAAKTAAKMDSGIGGSFRKLMSAVEGLAISIGDSLAPTISKIAEFVTENIGVWTEWIEQNKGIIIIVAGVVAGLVAGGIALMGLSVIVSALGTVLGVVGSALSLVGTLLGFIISPVGLVIAAIIAVIAILYKFSDTFREIANKVVSFVSERFGQIAGTMKKTIGGIVKAIAKGDLTKAWAIMTTGMQLAWLQLVDIFKDVWRNFTSFFVEAWTGAMTSMKRVWFSTQKTIATGLLDLAAKEGILGDIMDGIIGSGVDTSEEKKRSAKLARQQLEQLIRLQTTTIPKEQANLAKLQDEATKAMKEVKDAGGQVGSIDELLAQGEADMTGSTNIGEAQLDAFRNSDDPEERMRALMADVWSKQNFIADMERRVAGGTQNGFDDARQAMRDSFDDKIAQAENDAGQFLNDRNADLDKADAERQAAIDKQTKALDELVAGLDEKDDAEAKAEELGGDAGNELDDMKARLDGLLGEGGSPSTGIKIQPNEALEKGTVAAAKKAYMNQFNASAKDAIEVAKDHMDLTDKVLGEMVELNDKFNIA